MKLKRLRFAALFLAGCIAVGTLIGFSFRGLERNGEKRQLHLALVVYGSGDRWTSLDLGIQQACETLGVYPPTLVVADGTTAEDQLALIEREVQNGAGALLVAVNDSDGLADALAEYAEQVPLVLLETGAGSLPVVQADNVAAGREMASHLAEAENLVLVEYNLQRESVAARHAGLAEGLGSTGYERLAVETGQPLGPVLADYLLANPFATLVCLDAFATEAAIDAAEARPGTTVYGFGGTDKIVNALDRGIVRMLCYENDFNTGYIGMCSLAEQMGLDAPTVRSGTGYLFVDDETMYEPEIERLLFPIIQ